MADHADDDDYDDVFVYMGGDQEVPRDATHIRIHKSVKIIRARAFFNCSLVSIELELGLGLGLGLGVEIIEGGAFLGCCSLRRIKLPGVRVIGESAFDACTALEDVEFGDKLETIEDHAFNQSSLRTIKIPRVRDIGYAAFWGCQQLTDVDLSEDLESMVGSVFERCPHLGRIAIPLKDNLLGDHAFDDCGNLSTVDLVEGIHKTISSLLLDSWRNEMKNEIDRINRDLPNTSHGKTSAIDQWMERVIRRIEYYKMEHGTLLKEFTTLLELALWKAKLDESQEERSRGSDRPAKKAKIDMKASRQEQRITSGANIVIKNVLPFLKLE